ncbi:MAG: NAD(P)H-hydrate dehydratase [Opitutaceae bacterium]|jgi:NAD(P)H-hydrate epimerase
MIDAHPILTCAEAKEFEAAWFAGDEVREWTAMQQAGHAVADALLNDFREIGAFPSAARLLVLAGKGHNAGDALIAARRIAEKYPQSRVEVRFVLGERALRPLAQRAWRDLAPVATSASEWNSAGYDVVIDGVFGYQFRAPLDARAAAVLREVNALPIRFRAAVDLPSGLDDPSAFRADFTYATGIVKTPLLKLPNAGRVRCLDLGFNVERVATNAPDRVLTSATLDSLRGLRTSHSDKRTYGHLFVLGGSRSYPGAVLMSVMAALRSGAGLVTAFVPETLAPAYAARVPEAMWVGWPEAPDGGLAMEGSHLLRERISRATALLIGPGLGREPETLALAKDIVSQSQVPLVIDADALQPDIVAAGKAKRILTPHAGEYARIERGLTPGMVTIQKGPVTRVKIGATTYHSFFGGPVLARGGSGDLLAGLTAGLLAQSPADAEGAALRGLVWHGLAADALAREHGQVAVTTSQVLDFMPAVLRG